MVLLECLYEQSPGLCCVRLIALHPSVSIPLSLSLSLSGDSLIGMFPLPSIQKRTKLQSVYVKTEPKSEKKCVCGLLLIGSLLHHWLSETPATPAHYSTLLTVYTHTNTHGSSPLSLKADNVFKWKPNEIHMIWSNCILSHLILIHHHHSPENSFLVSILSPPCSWRSLPSPCPVCPHIMWNIA